jgi:hypothetical protein
VATSAETIIVAALGRSAKNRPDYLATKAGELLEHCARALASCYAVAARINPTFFAAQATVPYSPTPGGWFRPVNAESVFQVEHNLSGRCDVVPFDDASSTGRPRLYEVGQVFYSLGNTGQSTGVADPPQSGNLVFLFSEAPATLTSLGQVFGSTWPDRFNQLLVDEVAIYLALKDGRQEEIGELKANRDGWLKLFVTFLEHENAATVFRHQPRSFADPGQVKQGDLFAGGTSVV